MYSKNIYQPVEYQFTADLSQAAATYDLCTAGDDILVQCQTMYVATAGATFTSVSVQSSNTTAFVFLSSVDGAVANLTAEASITPTSTSKWMLLKRGKKIQYTITGATGTGSLVCMFNTIKVKQAATLS